MRSDVDKMASFSDALQGDLRLFSADELHAARTVLIRVGRAAGASTEEIADVLQAAGLPLQRDLWSDPDVEYGDAPGDAPI